MGAEPATALAMAVVPLGTDAKVEEALFQLMAGASKVLTAAGCALVGGHSCEGDELALGTALGSLCHVCHGLPVFPGCASRLS